MSYSLAKKDLLSHILEILLIYYGHSVYRPKIVCYYLLPMICQLASSHSVTSSRPFWRIQWWIGANSRHGQNASDCSLFLVKVLWVCPLPHWCYVKWLNTQKPAINHVTPMEESGVAPKADRLTRMQKWKNYSRDWCYTDYILWVVWEISFQFFPPIPNPPPHNKLSHICIFCYDSTV